MGLQIRQWDIEDFMRLGNTVKIGMNTQDQATFMGVVD